jgi:type I restriction enzyme M protein
MSSATTSSPVRQCVDEALEQRLADWGNDEDEGDDEEGGAKKGLPEKKRKKLLDPKTWERDGRLVEVANKLRAALGDALFEDHNLFRDRSTPRSSRPASSSPPPT